MCACVCVCVCVKENVNEIDNTKWQNVIYYRTWYYSMGLENKFICVVSWKLRLKDTFRFPLEWRLQLSNRCPKSKCSKDKFTQSPWNIYVYISSKHFVDCYFNWFSVICSTELLWHFCFFFLQKSWSHTNKYILNILSIYVTITNFMCVETFKLRIWFSFFFHIHLYWNKYIHAKDWTLIITITAHTIKIKQHNSEWNGSVCFCFLSNTKFYRSLVNFIIIIFVVWSYSFLFFSFFFFFYFKPYRQIYWITYTQSYLYIHTKKKHFNRGMNNKNIYIHD